MCIIFAEKLKWLGANIYYILANSWGTISRSMETSYEQYKVDSLRHNAYEYIQIYI